MEKQAHNMPSVSVIMPAYNAEKYVEAAIRSVMAQTVTSWELLVLDDGSKDRTAQIVQQLAMEDPRVRFLPNAANIGCAGTRNRGLDLCQGEYVAFLDSDDIWHPQKLETQLALAKDSGADLLYCYYAIVDAEGAPAKDDYLVPARVDFSDLLRENVIGCSTVMLSRALVDRYRFTTDFYHEDYVLWLQILRDGYQAAGSQEVLVQWRFLENSRSFNKRKSAKNRWRIYRNYLKLPLWRSVWCFLAYAYHALKKYRKAN